MEANRFDKLSRGLAQRASRRSVVRGIAAGGAALAAGRAASALAAPAPKVDVCHLDEETGAYHLINVSGNALDAHLAHGDFVQGSEETVNLTISATNPDPVDTGVFLADGESAAVTITGLAGFCCGLAVDANGSGACGGLGIPFSCGSVVGVVGGGNIFADYTPFVQLNAGANTVAATGTSGNLVLQFVDGCPSCYDDNSGAFDVAITVTRTC